MTHLSPVVIDAINTARADFRANENQPLHSRILTGLVKGIDHA